MVIWLDCAGELVGLGWVGHFVGLEIWLDRIVGWIGHLVGFCFWLHWRFGSVGLS